VAIDIGFESAHVVLADNLDKVGPGSLHVLELGIVLGAGELGNG
jgi:hypothetical protein